MELMPLLLAFIVVLKFPLPHDSTNDPFVGIAMLPLSFAFMSPNLFPMLSDSKNEFVFNSPIMFGAFTPIFLAKTSVPFNGIVGEEKGDIMKEPIDSFTVIKDTLSSPGLSETSSSPFKDDKGAFNNNGKTLPRNLWEAKMMPSHWYHRS
jgi:hypothetical protein